MRHIRPPLSKRVAFTIIEIAVVVTIIGILAALAIPAYKRGKDSAIIATLENDFRVFVQEFHTYELDFGTYPATQTAEAFPIGMEDRMSHRWLEPSVIGGSYHWIYSGDDADDRYAYIEVTRNSSDLLRINRGRLIEIDEDLDDGNLETGKLRLIDLNIRFYVEQ